MPLDELTTYYAGIFYTVAKVIPEFVSGVGAGCGIMVVVKRLQGMTDKERANLWNNVLLSLLVPFVAATIHIRTSATYPYVFEISFGGSLGGTYFALWWYSSIGPFGKKLTKFFMNHFITPIGDSFKDKPE